MGNYKKSEQTKAIVMETALELFRAEGFAETTMRQIAKKAGIALGTIYIYFKSKEELVLEYYQKVQQELLLQTSVDTQKKPYRLEVGLKDFFYLQFKMLEKDKKFLSALASAAATPDNPVSPFGKESKHIRKLHMEMLKKIVDNSKTKIHPKVQKELPELLWFLQMGLIFFWVHDKSKESVKSIEMTDTTVELIGTFLKIHNKPFASGLRNSLLKIIKNLVSIVDET
ncbi:MAG: TetR/AcrR family transcriptional regulator [Leptospirales bacterium]